MGMHQGWRDWRDGSVVVKSEGCSSEQHPSLIPSTQMTAKNGLQLQFQRDPMPSPGLCAH